MNILIISAVFFPEPVVSAKLSEDIATSLAEENNVTVLSPMPTRPFGFVFKDENKPFDKFKLVRLRSYTCPKSKALGRLRESYSFGLACKKYISRNFKDIDLIYMNSWPMFSQFVIMKMAIKHDIKVITHVQDVYPESLSNKLPKFSSVLNFIFMPIDKFVLKNSYRVIAISSKMKNLLAKTRELTESKIEVVQNWQDEELFTNYLQTKKKNSNLLTFMYLGNIGPIAGIDLLLEAFSKANLNNSRLVIAGSGSKKEALQRNALELNPNTIEFWDVPEGKVPEIQGQADVMLLPIKKGAASSSIPSKLPAYMFSKKPIISCVDADSDTALAIKSSSCGWVLPPGNVDALTLKIKEIGKMTHVELLKTGINGFNFAYNNFSKKSNLKRLVSIITTCK